MFDNADYAFRGQRVALIPEDLASDFSSVSFEFDNIDNAIRVERIAPIPPGFASDFS